MTWLVRLGTERGKGRYVSRVTATHDVAGLHQYHWTTERQWAARRFEWRPLAKLWARDYGGRVVRLRRRER